ncbi:reverse transcriptase domain-containing protein [Tanacetum coccineum]
MHTHASNFELVEPLPELERTLNGRLHQRNRGVLFEQRNNPPQQPRVFYTSILDINYFCHFLITLQNLNPMDDEPMWATDRVVAPTPGSVITIPETTNEFAIKLSKNEVVHLMMFPLPLTREAKTWLDELNERTIDTWDELRIAFISRLFPLALFDRLLVEIRAFSQHENESLTDAWLRMKEMLRNCPGRNLSKGNIIKIFYHGLNEITQVVLNAATGGIFLYKIPNQAYQLLEDKVLLKLDWAKNQITKPSLKKTIAFTDKGSSNSNTNKIMDRMDAMTMKMDAQYKEIQSCSKQLNPNDDDIPMSREEEAKFMQTFHRICFYNDYRDHDSNRDNWRSSERNDYNRDDCQSNSNNKPDLQKQLSDFIKAQHSANSFVKYTFMDLKNKLETTTKNHQASIQNLKAKFDRFADKQSGRLPRSLPKFDIENKDTKGTKNVATDHLSRIENDKTSDDSKVDNNFSRETLMEINSRDEPWFADFANYLVSDIIPKGMTYQQKDIFFSDLKHYFWEEPYLFKVCSEGMIRRCVSGPKTQTILDQCHHGPTDGHYGTNTTAKKVLDSGFYWPTIIKEAHTQVCLCEACQKTGNISKRDEMPLNSIQVCKIFNIWGIDFM